ncbi:hypothetical protein FBQ85_29010 [Cytophagia bacterium CHB2]|nr:hypothetical protein [Cytophagia bacterium CHB2]
MRKLTFSVIVILTFADLFGLSNARAQSVVLDFSFGAIYPAQTAGGLYPGVTLHKTIKKRGVLQMDLGVGAAYYQRNYSDLAIVEPYLNPNSGSALPFAEVKFSRKLVPISFKPTFKISFIERSLPKLRPVRGAARAGMESTSDIKDTGVFLRPHVSYYRLSSEESNEVNSSSISRTYKDWGWGSELGFYLTMTNKVSTSISVLYNRAALDREENEEPAGLPVDTVVKLHGVGFLLSVGMGF